MRSFYTALFYVVQPLIVGRLLWRSLKAPAYRARIRERFGYYPNPLRTGSIWVHAVSVGEAEAAFPLIKELIKRHPDVPILVTTTTPTGSSRVQAVLGDAVDHVYLPYDLPGAVGRFLNASRPRLAVIMETEIWPNLFQATHSRGIPLAIVNGRLSERSANGYAKISSLTASSLSAVSWVGAQSSVDAERFKRLGARPDCVEAVGNIKFDVEVPIGIAQDCADLRIRLFGGRPAVIAGSTHDGEEQTLLDAASAWRAAFPELLLILVPRHPERFPVVAELCRKQGWSLARRSEGDHSVTAQVFLLDTMGELRLFYGASDIAFVGGSLVPTGGHNLLEPAALGVPVVFGPHTFNFRDMSRDMLASGAGVRVNDGAELKDAVLRLLGDESARAVLAEHGRNFVKRGQGALRQVIGKLDSWLGEPAVVD